MSAVPAPPLLPSDVASDPFPSPAKRQRLHDGAKNADAGDNNALLAQLALEREQRRKGIGKSIGKGAAVDAALSKVWRAPSAKSVSAPVAEPVAEPVAKSVSAPVAEPVAEPTIKIEAESKTEAPAAVLLPQSVLRNLLADAVCLASQGPVALGFKPCQTPGCKSFLSIAAAVRYAQVGLKPACALGSCATCVEAAAAIRTKADEKLVLDAKAVDHALRAGIELKVPDASRTSRADAAAGVSLEARARDAKDCVGCRVTRDSAAQLQDDDPVQPLLRQNAWLASARLGLGGFAQSAQPLFRCTCGDYCDLNPLKLTPALHPDAVRLHTMLQGMPQQTELVHELLAADPYVRCTPAGLAAQCPHCSTPLLPAQALQHAIRCSRRPIACAELNLSLFGVKNPGTCHAVLTLNMAPGAAAAAERTTVLFQHLLECKACVLVESVAETKTELHMVVNSSIRMLDLLLTARDPRKPTPPAPKVGKGQLHMGIRPILDEAVELLARVMRHGKESYGVRASSFFQLPIATLVRLFLRAEPALQPLCAFLREVEQEVTIPSFDKSASTPFLLSKNVARARQWSNFLHTMLARHCAGLLRQSGRSAALCATLCAHIQNKYVVEEVVAPLEQQEIVLID